MRLSLLCLALLATPALAQTGGPVVNRSLFADASITRVTAVTEVFGAGQRISGARVLLAAQVSPEALTLASFTVEGRRITAVELEPDHQTARLHLDPTDETAPIFGPQLDQAPELLVSLAKPLGPLKASAKPVLNTAVQNEIVDQFVQRRFIDPVTGLALDYNLFIPAKAGPQPLVMFLHDAGVTGSNPRRVLHQGLGAVAFASPEDQARHPAYVLAPQFPVPLANDAGQVSAYVEMLPRLLAALQTEHAIDPARLYTTGQSGGCMSSIALNLAQPELFAGTLCVAGQWDATLTKPLAQHNFWAAVSEDDGKAYPGMSAIMASVEAAGGQVTRGQLDAKSPDLAQSTEALVAKAQAEGSHVVMSSFTAGSVLPEGAATPGAGHVNTWPHAYALAPLRDWLLAQRHP